MHVSSAGHAEGEYLSAACLVCLSFEESRFVFFVFFDVKRAARQKTALLIAKPSLYLYLSDDGIARGSARYLHVVVGEVVEDVLAAGEGGYARAGELEYAVRLHELDEFVYLVGFAGHLAGDG